MKAPVAALKAARESRPGGRINLQESQSTTAATRQIRLLHASKNLQQVRGLGVLHGRLISLGLDAATVDWPALIRRAVYREPPFSTGQEKGFRDSVLLEQFVQLASGLPRSSNSCRVHLLTSDALLTAAAVERASDWSNVSVVTDLDALRT